MILTFTLNNPSREDKPVTWAATLTGPDRNLPRCHKHQGGKATALRFAIGMALPTATPAPTPLPTLTPTAIHAPTPSPTATPAPTPTSKADEADPVEPRLDREAA